MWGLGGGGLEIGVQDHMGLGVQVQAGLEAPSAFLTQADGQMKQTLGSGEGVELGYDEAIFRHPFCMVYRRSGCLLGI